MLERAHFYKEYGWTPAELAEVPDQEIQDLKEVFRWRAFYQDRERRRAERAG